MVFMAAMIDLLQLYTKSFKAKRSFHLKWIFVHKKCIFILFKDWKYNEWFKFTCESFFSPSRCTKACLLRRSSAMGHASQWNVYLIKVTRRPILMFWVTSHWSQGICLWPFPHCWNFVPRTGTAVVPWSRNLHGRAKWFSHVNLFLWQIIIQ